MGSDNSNGSAHKHLAQFTLSNAPHGPTFSSCLSVCMLAKPKRYFFQNILKYVHFCIFLHPDCSFRPKSIFLKLIHDFFFLIHTLFGFIFLNVSFPSPSLSLYNNLYGFLSFFTPLPLSLPPSHPPFPSSLFLHPLRAAGTGGLWQVAAVLCLSACRRLPTRVCVCVC